MNWNKAILIFDTSSIIECYWYSPETIQFIQNEIFKYFENRIYLPDQVRIEYFRHKDIKKNAAANRYTELKEAGKNKDGGYLAKITNEIITIKGIINTLIEETKTIEKHPWLNIDTTTPLMQITQKYEDDSKVLIAAIEKEIDSRIHAIHHTEDIVFEGINKYFKNAREYSFTEKFEIAQEGELRYKMEIPPGYYDAKGNDAKIGLDKYGDLFIWKQIIEISKEINCPIIFVINDLKIDWCHKEDKNPSRIASPRRELIEEFKELTGNKIELLSLPQFLFDSQKIIGINLPSKQPIKDIDTKVKRIELFASNGDIDSFGVRHDIEGFCFVSKSDILSIIHSFKLKNKKDFSYFIKEITLCISKRTLAGWATIRRGLPYIVDDELLPNQEKVIKSFAISVSRSDLVSLENCWITFEVKSNTEQRQSFGTMYTHWHELEEIEIE
jgi:hypothetical protein